MLVDSPLKIVVMLSDLWGWGENGIFCAGFKVMSICERSLFLFHSYLLISSCLFCCEIAVHLLIRHQIVFGL